MPGCSHQAAWNLKLKTQASHRKHINLLMLERFLESEVQTKEINWEMSSLLHLGKESKWRPHSTRFSTRSCLSIIMQFKLYYAISMIIWIYALRGKWGIKPKLSTNSCWVNHRLVPILAMQQNVHSFEFVPHSKVRERGHSSDHNQWYMLPGSRRTLTASSE